MYYALSSSSAWSSNSAMLSAKSHVRWGMGKHSQSVHRMVGTCRVGEGDGETVTHEIIRNNPTKMLSMAQSALS